MQSFDYISEKLGVSPTLDPFLGMCRTMRADLRSVCTLSFGARGLSMSNKCAGIATNIYWLVVLYPLSMSRPLQPIIHGAHQSCGLLRSMTASQYHFVLMG